MGFDYRTWAQEVLRGADSDADEHVSAAELHAMEESGSPSGMEGFVKEHDEDKDSRLSLQELEKSVMGMVHENSKEAEDFLNLPTTTSTSVVMLRYRKNPETGKMEMESIDYDDYLGVDPNLPQFMKEPLVKEAEAKLKKEQRR